MLGGIHKNCDALQKILIKNVDLNNDRDFKEYKKNSKWKGNKIFKMILYKFKISNYYWTKQYFSYNQLMKKIV